MQNSKVSLEKLLVLYRESDPNAFKEFFRRTSKLVFNFLYLRLQNKSAAEDVMQDTYFRVHRYVATYDPNRAAMSWVISIAKNALIDHVRVTRTLSRSQSIGDVELESPGLNPEKLAELRQIVEEVCTDLSPDERQLFFERAVNEETFEDIARPRGITVENARQKFSRLMKKLRSTIGNA